MESICWKNIDWIDIDVDGVDQKSVDWRGVGLIDIDVDCRFDSNCLNSVVSKEGDSGGIGHWEKGIHLKGRLDSGDGDCCGDDH